MSFTESCKLKYERYRESVEKLLLEPERFQRFSLQETSGQMRVVAAWNSRSLSRFVAMECNSTWTLRLADRPAADILIARHRHTDASFAEVPKWTDALTTYINLMLLGGPRAKQDWNGDPPQLDTVHSHGPSLRQLWAQAKAAGADDEAAWGAIVNWILYRPPSWERDDLRKKARKPLYDGQLSQRLDTAVEWTSTGDLGFPWAASGGDQQWRVRVNDFPDEYMYTLMTGDEVIGDFHDWPLSWTRAEGSGWVDPKSTPTITIFVPQQGIAPERLVERYMAGEEKGVWDDLIRLGPSVRKKPYLKPAEAVCREMTRRSRQNLVTLFGRLHELEFEFWSSKSGELIRLTEPEAKEPWKQPAVWVPPQKADVADLARLEKKGIVLPLAVRVWAEQIGFVSFTGKHPQLCPFYLDSKPEAYADPFMVAPITAMLSTSLDELQGETEPFLISHGDVLKAEIAMDPGSDNEYTIEYPNAVADAKIDGLWYDATFVGYLRKNFEWGGFPGWERYSQRPDKDLDFLREGLLPI